MIREASKFIQTIGRFSPIKFNFILMGSAIYLLYYLKNNSQILLEKTAETLSTHKIIVLLLEIGFYLLLSLAIISLAFNLINWLVNLLRIRLQTAPLDINKLQNGRLKIIVNKAYAPMLGTLTGIITLKNKAHIYPILFLKNNIQQFTLKGTTISQALALPHYKTYTFKYLTLQYTDLLRMTALPIRIQQNFTYTHFPPSYKIPQLKVKPLLNITFDEQHQSTTKKDGELLHYKNFETGDDIRRIVWKIYAKNKELIVRVPETEYENTQGGLFYAPTYMETSLSHRYADLALDYFKEATWNIYNNYKEQLVLFWKEDTPAKNLLTHTTSIQNQLLEIEWQNTLLPDAVFEPQKDNILCLHAGITLAVIEKISLSIKPATILYWIPLQDAFSTSLLWNNIQKIFFVAKRSDKIKNIKNAFQLSKTKKTWQKNEKAALALLKQQHLQVTIWKVPKKK